MDKGFFGGMFDFNGDGKLDSFERAADFAAFVNLTSSTDDETEAEDDSSSFSFDSEDELEDDVDSDEYDFMGTGYSRDELELMDDNERIEVLLDAGVDLDDCDF